MCACGHDFTKKINCTSVGIFILPFLGRVVFTFDIGKLKALKNY